jgi:hypothetical protein
MRPLKFFNLPNPSSRTIALGSTYLLTEVSARNLSGGKARPERKADNLTAICEYCPGNVGTSASHSPVDPHDLYWDSLYMYFLYFTCQLLVTANAVPSSLILVILMKKALSSSETSVLTRATWRNIPEDTILHSHRREDLKSYMSLVCLLLA